MKKRLFTMLLLLCLLLTALTATVAAESTNANGGHLEFYLQWAGQLRSY